MTGAFEHQGFNLIAFNKGDFADPDLLARSLDYIRDSGANFVNVDWMVAFEDDGRIVPASSERSGEPAIEDLEQVIAMAHARGLSVSLKPHVSFPDSFENRMEWNSNMAEFSMPRFFAEWARYLESVGQLAHRTGVEMLVIGTELAGFDRAHRNEWVDLIDRVRVVYDGDIGYCALFNVDDYHFLVDDVVFWDRVDVIGLSLYVPLSLNDDASPAELNAAWLDNPFGSIGNVIAYLKNLSDTYGKPVMAMESGFQSIIGGLRDVGPVATLRDVDNAVQAAGIASLLDVLGKYQGQWFDGLSLWSVFPPFLDETNQDGWGYRQGYMTNGKPAAEVIRDYFSGVRTYSDPVFRGGITEGLLTGSYADDLILGGIGRETIWAGAGNDTIVFSTAGQDRPTTASIAISATGDVFEGEGPWFQLWINGQQVGPTMQARQPGDFVFTLPLATIDAIEQFSIRTLPDPKFSQGVNRALVVHAIEVNGSALTEDDGTYVVGSSRTNGPGSWSRLWSGTELTQDVSLHQDVFFGSPTNEDRIDGATGVDTVVFAGRSDTFTLSRQTGSWVVAEQTEGTASAMLQNIERVQFDDRTFDLVDLPRQGVPAFGQQSGFLFDAVYYLLDNPGLVPTHDLATAAAHYIETGATQGNAPNAWFDAAYYENRWPDLKAGDFGDAVLFMHYNLYGVWEGRSAGPKFDRFDGLRYLTDNPDVAAYVDAYLADFLGSRTNGAIAHYVIYGQHEERPAFDLAGVRIDLGYTIDLGR